MIKIIKNTMFEPIEITCGICQSIFSYNYEDIQSKERKTIFSNTPMKETFVTCPVCKSDIILRRAEVEESDNED